jgi:NADH:ubiquinone oxidoreductase subunit C
MFGIFFISKIDARNLLLDYSLNENPLLKVYPSVGLREVSYSILSEGVTYSYVSSVEL